MEKLNEEEQRAQNILEIQLRELNDNGFNKLLAKEFDDFILWGREFLTIEQIVERYGNVLTEEQLAKIKELLNIK